MIYDIMTLISYNIGCHLRLAPLPARPQPIIVERWLAFPEQRRRVVFTRHPEPDAYYEKPRNMIIQWEQPQVKITREYRDLGVVRANPEEYLARFGADKLLSASQLPDFVRNIRPPTGLVLASDMPFVHRVPELEGDLFALSMFDLEREGLGEYRGYIGRFGGESFRGIYFHIISYNDEISFHIQIF